MNARYKYVGRAKRVHTNARAEIEFYRDRNGDWRWRAIAPENGKRLAAATEGYRNKAELIQAMKRTARGLVETAEWNE